MLSDLRCDIVGTMVWHWIDWIDLRFIRRFFNAPINKMRNIWRLQDDLVQTIG